MTFRSDLATGTSVTATFRNYINSLAINNNLMTENCEVHPHILPRRSRRD
jgi:hypothetical protein